MFFVQTGQSQGNRDIARKEPLKLRVNRDGLEIKPIGRKVFTDNLEFTAGVIRATGL